MMFDSKNKHNIEFDDEVIKQEEIDKSANSDSFDDADKLNNNENIAGARGAFSHGLKRKQLPAGARIFLFVIITAAVIFGAFLSWKAWQVHNDQKTNRADNLIRNTLPPLKPLPPKTADDEYRQQHTHNQEVDNAAAEEPILQPELSREISPAEALKLRRLSPELTGNNNGSGAQQTSASNNGQNSFNDSGVNDKDSNNNEFQNKLEPLKLDPSAAGLIGNANYLLTQGTMIDCQLETRMITTQDGMTSCYTTRNIYSTNGRVILIDRGSKIVGHYQGGMQQGQARIFVLWTRIETPKGIIVNLDSPGSGSLGESGVGGTIDTHFWQRFGGAIMISLIGDFGQFVANKGQKGSNNNTIQFGNTREGMQQAATEALKNSINIPPTLYKNQGERISIFVARDLDFGKVYGLKIQQQ